MGTLKGQNYSNELDWKSLFSKEVEKNSESEEFQKVVYTFGPAENENEV